jgi:hypothetical protein
MRAEESISVEPGGERTVWLTMNARAPSTAAAPPPGPRASKTGDLPDAAPRPSKAAPALRWWVVGGLAATTAALGVFGTVAVVSANAAADEREASRLRVVGHVSGCPGGSDCDDFTAADGRAKTMTGLAVGAFIGAGLAAAGAGAAAYLLAPAAPVRVGATPSGALVVAW